MTNLIEKRNPSLIACLLLSTMISSTASADDKKNDAKFYGDFRLRYETVSQDNPLEDADALTLRARLGYKTAA